MKAGIGNHQEECVDTHVEVERRERVTRVTVVPHANLKGNYDGRVEEQKPAHKEHHCKTHVFKAWHHKF